MKTYCLSCNQPTEFSFTKPKFCANCGASFETTTASVPKTPASSPKQLSLAEKLKQQRPKSRPAPPPPPDDDDFETEEPTETLDDMPEIEELDVEIEPFRLDGDRIENIVATSPNKPLRNKTKLSAAQKKKIIAEVRKEGGSKR